MFIKGIINNPFNIVYAANLFNTFFRNFNAIIKLVTTGSKVPKNASIDSHFKTFALNSKSSGANSVYVHGFAYTNKQNDNESPKYKIMFRQSVTFLRINLTLLSTNAVEMCGIMAAVNPGAKIIGIAVSFVPA